MPSPLLINSPPWVHLLCSAEIKETMCLTHWMPKGMLRELHALLWHQHRDMPDLLDTGAIQLPAADKSRRLHLTTIMILSYPSSLKAITTALNWLYTSAQLQIFNFYPNVTVFWQIFARQKAHISCVELNVHVVQYILYVGCIIHSVICHKVSQRALIAYETKQTRSISTESLTRL